MRSNKLLGTNMKWFRWLAVIPSSIIAWYAMFILGMFVLFGINYLCPPEDIVSGQCMAWWYSYAEQSTIYLFVALSAFFVVVCAAIVAPSHRMYVAWVAYLSGFLVAVYFVSQTSTVGEFVSAILAGLLGVFSVAKFLGRQISPDKALQSTH
ncbi:MAG: hypothetical protein JXQ97_17070 [Natronospirillum sp.]